MQKTFSLPRRTLALSLIMAVILTMFALPAFAAELNGDGTADAPYLIGTEADLLTFQEKVTSGQWDAHARLTSDLSLTNLWTPIGTPDTPFTGTFDGDGHTISNFATQYYTSIATLFVCNSGTIQNLTVDTTGSFAYIMGMDYAAAICAINRGTIRNCTSKGYIYGYNDKTFVGGIAAVNFGTIADCHNAALIGGAGNDACVGGIVGVSADGTVSGCTNTGEISMYDGGKQSTELCVGGIVGLNYKSTVDRCTNQGAVKADSTQGYTGGVAGLNNGLVSNSLNTAGISDKGLHGGVAGYVFTNADTGMIAQVRNTLDLGSNGVCGKNEGGTLANNFYKSADGSTGTEQIAVTDTQLQSGEVAYHLNGMNSTAPVWGQALGTDSAPSLGNPQVVYAQYQDGSLIGYTNQADQSHTHSFDASGQCTVDGCGYASVRLDGRTLTLDGALGVTFYYEIDPIYLTDGYTVSVTFTMDGKETNVPLDTHYSYRTDNKTVYGFRFYVDSDKATHAIAPVLTVQKDGATVVTLSQEQTYRIYDYLQTILDNPSGEYSTELVQLAKALATYDYYANEYFRYSDSYKPSIPLLSLKDVTADALAPYRQVTAADEEGIYPLRHYASNLRLQEAVAPRYLAALVDPTANPVDADNLYMGYRAAGSGALYTYVKVAKSGDRYLGDAAKRPASDLGTAYEIAFFVKEGDSYRQVSPVKQASVYSYIYTVLNSSASKESLQNVARALFLYGEAAKDYFASVH